MTHAHASAEGPALTRSTQGWLALLRRLARRPGFALAVLITLALGVGANTVTFDLLYSYLLAPLPYAHSEQLVEVYFTSPAAPAVASSSAGLGMSYTTYFDLRKDSTLMADAGMVNVLDVNLIAGKQVLHVRGAQISASLLSTLGVPPVAGRLFGPEANEPGAAPQVLISDRLWSQLFGRDPATAGKTIRVDGTAYTVAGVMPPRFQLPDPDTDLWMARTFGPAERSANNLTAFGNTMIVRLKPGVSLSQLAAQAQTVVDHEIAHFPYPDRIPILRKFKLHMVASPLRDALVGDLQEHLLLAQLATGLLLLLIWVNLANLFIARALQQRGELVLRRVLGAQTLVLFRALLAESLTLSVAGSAAGLLLGELAVRALLQAGIVSAALPPVHDVLLAVGLALLLALLSALVFALTGSYFIRRQDLAQALKNLDVRSAGGRGERRVRAGFVITQLTIACALTAIGLTLTHSLMNLGSLKLGFTPENLVTFQIHFPKLTDRKASPRVQQLTQLRHALHLVPGALAVTLADSLPFDGQLQGQGVFPHPFDGKHTPTAVAVTTDSEYFRTMQVALRAGDVPTGTPAAEGEAIVDAQAARALYGSTDAVGRELVFNSPEVMKPYFLFRVKGVVDETRRTYGDLDSSGHVYVNLDQVLDAQARDGGAYFTTDTWFVVVRTPLSTAAILPALQKAVQSALPGVPVYDVRTMQGRMSKMLAPRRNLAALVLAFAISALAVAGVGLYAVASYTVSQRRPELGVRAALGADQAQLRLLVLREILKQLAIGVPLGLAAAIVVGRAFASTLYDVRPADLPSLIVVTLVLALVTLLAGWVPAWRASRVPPLEAIRQH